MKVLLHILLILLLLAPCKTFAKEYLYILDDACISNLYNAAEEHFQNTDVTTVRDPRGIILRHEFEDTEAEYYNLNSDTYKAIEDFLAKIENPAIIEVHTGNFSCNEFLNRKNWEISIIMANNIESVITKPAGTVDQKRINSIGYGEFLPAKNTSNNGGKHSNRVDIIILCNISGE